MPGPQDPSDQAAGAYGRGYDAPRRSDLSDEPADRPARGSLTELRQRLERLRPGHPSSPYHDDGSRKPPVVRLKDLELPGDAGTSETEAAQAHGDEAEIQRETGQRETGLHDASQRETDSPEANPYGTDGPDAAENAPGSMEETVREEAIDPPRTWADGSWEWKGQRLKSGECKIAEEMLGQCRAAEGRTVFGTYGDTGLTPAMRRVEAQLEHGHLVPETEKFALKSADRFKEKLAKLITRNPDKPSSELATEIHDNVRYTYLFEEEHYFEGVWQAHTVLEDHGYELEVRRNSWDNPEYKGINTRWRDTDHDIRFELQFHTPPSWDAKQRTHNAYERIADPRTSPGERARLRSEQAKVSATIPVPPRCEEIDDYRKEGH